MRNLCTNPSFETTAGGFWTGNATRSNDYAYHGSYSAKVTTTWTAGTITGGHNYLNNSSTDVITSQIGKMYLFTGWIYVPVGSPIIRVNNFAIRRFSNYNALSSGNSRNFTPGTWVRCMAKWLATENIQLRFTVADPVATGYTGSASYYTDGVRIEMPSPMAVNEMNRPY